MRSDWPSRAFAVVMIVTALYHLGRLVAARAARRLESVDVDATHTAMGVGMAVMLVGWLTPGASHWWAAGFAIPTAWFGWRAAQGGLRDGARFVGNHLRQAVASGAMLFMLLAVAVTAGTASAVSASADPMASGSMAAMPGMADPTTTRAARGMAMPHLGGTAGGRLLDVVLVVAMTGVATWTAVLLVRGIKARRAGSHGPRAWSATCQLAMNVTTVYMLALML